MPTTRAMYRRRNARTPCRLTKVVLASFAALFFVYIASKNTTTKDQQLLRSNAYNDDSKRCHILNTSTPDDLARLDVLNLKGCSLSNIPNKIQYAINLRHLDVSENPLLTLPSELVHCTKLDVLFVSSCPSISSLPPVLGEMPSITRLGWRSGSLTSIDPNGLPPNLIHLILTDNQIETLDDARIFQKLKGVRKLMLSHNNVVNFGNNGGLDQLQSLELLRLAGNNLTEIPAELWKLPKLTWLTISGNPVTNQPKSKVNASSIPSITMKDLTSTGKFLGEGASGLVQLYKWQNKEVAVKLIHGVTSDGKAEDELSIYSAVGSSGVEYRVVGCLALLDDERKGVVMEPLPSNLDDFALPPTIVEVTVDRWDENSTFSASFVRNALRDSASALNFLHGTIGVSHGDFYAHNIKVDRSTGRVYLLDFGASFFKGKYATEAEKIEVRAFGVLIGELLHLLDPKIEENELRAKLISLHSQCTDANVDARPSFADIEAVMMSL